MSFQDLRGRLLSLVPDTENNGRQKMAKFNHDEIRDTLRINERTQSISATARELGVKRETRT